MTSAISKVMFWLWPPYEAWVAAKVIDGGTDVSDWSRMEDVKQQIRLGLDSDTELDELKAIAKLVFESENKRKETLESKALTFVAAFGLSITIVSALPLLFDRWQISTLDAVASLCAYAFAVLHLLVAVYYSMAARRVVGLAVPSADEFLRIVEQRQQLLQTEERRVKPSGWRGIRWLANIRRLTSQMCSYAPGKGTMLEKELVKYQIVEYIWKAKFNEPLLTKKANCLAVAETMFLRGLVFVAIAASISATAQLFSNVL